MKNGASTTNTCSATGVNFEWLTTGRGALRFQPSLDDVPAADMEIVEDPLELRLLRVFRAAPQRQQARIVAGLQATYAEMATVILRAEL